MSLMYFKLYLFTCFLRSGRFSRQVSADNLDDSFDDSVAGIYT